MQRLAPIPSTRVVLIAACLVLVPAAAGAAPPRVLVELSHRDGTDPAPRPGRVDAPAFLSDILVRTDGSFVRDGRAGTLAAADRARVARAASRARLRMAPAPRVHCEAVPNTTMRLATRRGTITWLSPCSPLPDDSVMALVTLISEVTGGGDTLAVPIVAPSPESPSVQPGSDVIVFSYDETSMRSLEDSERFVVYADGRVVAGGATTQLAPGDLAHIVRLAREVVPSSVPREEHHECAAMLTGQASIDVPGRGRYAWSTPCGQPHTTITTLLRETRRLVSVRPSPGLRLR